MRRLRGIVGVCLLVCASALVAPAQDAGPVDNGLFLGSTDYSGFDLVERYVALPADPSKLDALCRAKTDAIANSRKAAAAAVAAARAASDPVRLARSLNSEGRAALYTGDLDTAIAAFDEAYSVASTNEAIYSELAATSLYSEQARGVAWMRRGELENCAQNHNASMCIFPIAPAGRHTLKTGSEHAIECFERVLARDPKNLEVRWLLNVAYQTLGRYPDDVPKAYLVPPSAFESKEDVGRFVDVASSVGLDYVGNAGGAIVDDFDGDGFLDVMTSGVNPCEPMHMFRNTGDGTFTDVSAATKIADQTGGINLVQADYDNDGRLDVLVMRGGWEFPMRNSLLHANADGTYTDVTAGSGLGSTRYKTASAAWADYDGDGWLDLFVGHEQAPGQLFRNKHDGTFEDVTDRAGVGISAFTKGVAWGDYDNDGDPDLYVSNYGEDNFLFRNNGDGTFEEVGTELHVEKPARSFPCWFFDYDNDGFLDLFVVSNVVGGGEWLRPYLGLARQWDSIKLYHNNGKGGFDDATEATGLDRTVTAMGANYGDVDNDGYLDIYLGTGTPSYSALMPNLLFHNHDGKSFVDVTTSSGTGHLQKGHGVAFGDLDNDGNEDLFENVGGAVPGDTYNKVLFKNPGHDNNWISIRLVGVKANRSAIGAKLKLTLVGGERPGAMRYREVSSGGSFGSSPLAQHVGLGKATSIASLEVIWPGSRTRQVFTDVAPNQFVELREGDAKLVRRKTAQFALKTSAPAGHAGHNHPGQ